MIPPGNFLHVAERFGLIQEIDRWVVRRGRRACSPSTRPRAVELALCVNLSGEVDRDPSVLVAHRARARATPAPIEPGALHRDDGDGRDRQHGSGQALRRARWPSSAASSRSTTSAPASPPSTTSSTSRSTCSRSTASSSATCPPATRTSCSSKSVVDIARGLGKRTVAEFVERRGDARAAARAWAWTSPRATTWRSLSRWTPWVSSPTSTRAQAVRTRRARRPGSQAAWRSAWRSRCRARRRRRARARGASLVIPRPRASGTTATI